MQQFGGQIVENYERKFGQGSGVWRQKSDLELRKFGHESGAWRKEIGSGTKKNLGRGLGLGDKSDLELNKIWAGVWG